CCLSSLERLRELISRLPALVRAAGADRVEVIGDRMFLSRQLPKQKKHADRHQHDAEGKEYELEEDVAGGFFGDIGHRMRNAECRMQNAERAKTFCILHSAFCIRLTGQCLLPRSPADIPS